MKMKMILVLSAGVCLLALACSLLAVVVAYRGYCARWEERCTTTCLDEPPPAADEFCVRSQWRCAQHCTRGGVCVIPVPYSTPTGTIMTKDNNGLYWLDGIMDYIHLNDRSVEEADD